MAEIVYVGRRFIETVREELVVLVVVVSAHASVVLVADGTHVLEMALH